MWECQFGKQLGQVAPREGPLEWSGQCFIVTLEGQEPVLNGSQGIEVVRRQDLALDDGEVDLDLIEPTRMDGAVNEHQMRVLPLQSVHGARTTVGRAAVNDPEDTPRVVIRRRGHHLLDESVERVDPGRGLAAAKEPGVMHIQGGQVGPGSGALVLVLDLHDRARPGRPCGVTASARLNARFLIGGNHEIVGRQGLRLPDALVQIEDATGLGRKLGIARKDPAAVEPRPNRVVVQPAPDGAAADGRHQPGPLSFGGQLTHAPARQRTLGARRQLTGERFDGDDDFWGKKPGAAPSVPDPPARGDGLQRSASARATPLRGASASCGRSRHSTTPRLRAESSSRGAPRNTAACILLPWRSRPVLHPPTAQSDKGSGEASSMQRSRAEYGAMFRASVQAENTLANL